VSVQGGAGFHVTATGIIVPAGGGTLHAVVINTGASGATLTLYDGTSASGAKIAAVAATTTAGLIYDIALVNGLYAVVSGAIDVTVSILPPARFND
jgi:hypothetical protein